MIMNECKEELKLVQLKRLGDWFDIETLISQQKGTG